MKQLALLGLGLTAATIFLPLFGTEVSTASHYVAAGGWLLAMIGLLLTKT